MKKLFTMLGILLTLAVIPSVLAQQPAATQSMTLPLGYVFEVLAVKDQPDAAVSWTLTKDGNFLQAGRDTAFRVRLVRSGIYTLTGEIISSDGSRRARKMLSILVTEETNVPSMSSGSALLSGTEPLADSSGRMLLVSGQDLITLIPNENLSSELLLDLDAATDSNGDGIATNDQDATDTFFSTRRTPLYLWIPTVSTERTIIVASSDASAATVQLQLVPNGSTGSSSNSISSSDSSLPPISSGSGSIGLTILENNRVRFDFNATGKPYASNPLLLQWDFGDGSQSLLDTPVHTYGRDGSYNVRLQVRDLTTSLVAEQLEATVEVTGVPVIPEPEPEPEPTTGGDTGGVVTPSVPGGSLLSLSLKLLLVAFISIVVGYGLMFVIGLIRRRGGLAGALDKAESKFTIPTNRTPSDIIDVAPPMKLADEEPEPVEPVVEPTEEIVETSVPAPEPEPVDTPDWLKAGLEQAAATGQNQVTPPLPEEAYETPAIPNMEMPPPETPPGEPEAAVQNAAEAPVQTAPEPVSTPDWLKAGLEQAESQTEPTPEPEPEVTVAEPAPAQVEAPVAQDTATNPPAANASEPTADEKEMERKRQKRRRYRQNKRRREKEEAAQPTPPPVVPTEPEAKPEVTKPEPEQAKPKVKAAPKKVTPKTIEQDIQPASDEDVTFLISADSISDKKKIPKKKKPADEDQKA